MLSIHIVAVPILEFLVYNNNFDWTLTISTKISTSQNKREKFRWQRQSDLWQAYRWATYSAQNCIVKKPFVEGNIGKEDIFIFEICFRMIYRLQISLKLIKSISTFGAWNTILPWTYSSFSHSYYWFVYIIYQRKGCIITSKRFILQSFREP